MGRRISSDVVLMATDRPVPIPREARRTEWPWGDDVVCVVDDGTAVHEDGTVTQMAVCDLGTIERRQGREVWLQLAGNRFAILTEINDDQPNGIWFVPASLIREAIVSAVDRERAVIASGTTYATAFCQVTNGGGRKLVRRGWQWATRQGRDRAIEWIDAAPLSWEAFCQTKWERTPAPRVPVPLDHAA